MINIYTKKELLPKDLIFIQNPDGAFLAVAFTGTEFQRRVLKEVEQGEYYNETDFIDRFGGRLYTTKMGTGSKSLMVADYFKDTHVVDMSEAGRNATYCLGYLPYCNVFIPESQLCIKDAPIKVDNVEYLNASHYNACRR